MKWPRYVILQRQRKVLSQRLKVPPTVNQFKNTLEKNQAAELFRLLAKYAPETAAEKKARLAAKAKAEAEGKPAEEKRAPFVVKYGLDNVTKLVEKKKAKLVLIADDVDPRSVPQDGRVVRDREGQGETGRAGAPEDGYVRVSDGREPRGRGDAELPSGVLRHQVRREQEVGRRHHGTEDPAQAEHPRCCDCR